MSLSKVCGVCSLAVLLFGFVLAGGWEIKDYERTHKPMAQAAWAWIAFKDCIDNCRADQISICRKLKPEATLAECEEKIDCSRCDVYKEER